MKPRVLLAAVLVVALAVAAAWGWRLRPAEVDALAVQPTALVRTVQFSGRVATAARVDLGATVTGRVAAVLVDEGAAVRQGQVLIRLETDELRAALDQAVAAERQAAARLAGLKATGRAGAGAALAQAESVLVAAKAELRRTEELIATGFVSTARLDEARRAVAVATAQVDGARAQTQAVADGGTEVAQADAQLALARSARAAAQARLAQAAISAPTDARVIGRDVEPGQIVQPGKALMSLALAGPVQLVAPVDERFLEQLRVGQRAAVVADAFTSQRLGARIESIAPRIDAQRGAVEVKLALDAAAPAFLREDMTLSIEVETARAERALVVPLSAVRGANGDRATVQRVRDGRVEDAAVVLGIRTARAVEVLEGLVAGDVVITAGRPLAVDSRVRPRAVALDAAMAAGAAPGGDGSAGASLTRAMGR